MINHTIEGKEDRKTAALRKALAEVTYPRCELFGALVTMHHQFGIVSNGRPHSLTAEEKRFRLVAMREELTEYEDAETLAGELDALVDAAVFLLGTAERHGFYEFNRAFVRVMEANFKKERGADEKRGSFEIDLVKPDGWTPPNLRDLVGEHTAFDDDVADDGHRYTDEEKL